MATAAYSIQTPSGCFHPSGPADRYLRRLLAETLLSNSQIEAHWSPAMIEAFMTLGENYPDIAGEIYALASEAMNEP